MHVDTEMIHQDWPMATDIINKKKQKTSRNSLIVFAREPRLGKGKTRLQKDLIPQDVLYLYTAFLKDILRLAKMVDCRWKFIFYTGANRHSLPFLGSYASWFSVRRQWGKDLGLRMWQAFRWVWYRSGGGPIIVIGTDCLSCQVQDMHEAFDRLNDHDCVIGPSRDGGYYLLGLNRPQKDLFIDIDWGSASVLQQTLEKIHRLGWRTHLLKKREDIDTLSDLKRFLRATPRKLIPPETQMAIMRIPILIPYLKSNADAFLQTNMLD
jgi:rSAM/selenodomain-associated transferase 1